MNKIITRSYKLKLYCNETKLDTARYTSLRFLEAVNRYCGVLFFDPKRKISTSGLGSLANLACYKAQGVIRAIHALQKSTEAKINVPVLSKVGTAARLELNRTSKHFDYWVTVMNLWAKGSPLRLPAKSHKALNRALREGWVLSGSCEFKIINGVPYAIVFVKKCASKIKRPRSFIGVDVGLKHSITTSEGHLGFGLRPVVRKQKGRMAERARQGHKISNKVRSEIKQLLDREAKTVMRRSQKVLAGLAVEDPKSIANLRSGKLQGWARSYFANRVHTLGKEWGVLVLDVNPAYTSQTCSPCGHVDKESRVSRDLFTCTSCGHTAHADVNAARNIARKGTQILDKILSRRSE